MGEWNTSSEVDCSSPSYCSDAPVDVPVERVIVHEQYVPTSRAQQNDIALIRLARPVQFSEWIKPICIPLINARVAQKSYVGEELFVAGWGRTETKSESDVKLKLRVPVVAESQCSSRYQSLGVNLERTQICAGGRQGQDSCRGDSGGPLMVLESDGETSNWYVIGLVSFGPTPCGMQGWPGVYTNVAQFTNWLRQNIRD